MEFKEMTIDQLVERKSAIGTELEAEDADLDALETEVRSINEELEIRKANAQKAEEVRKMVAEGAGEVIDTQKVEERHNMTNIEVRNSDAYINAFAEYIKTGEDTECRSLLTETVNGTVPVPTFVEGIITHAWENMPILSKVTRTNFAGNVKVGFEASATAAAVHTEGAAAPAEEELVLGIVNLVPETIKKWITISDEALEQNPVGLLEYIYSEIAYRIFKKAEDEVVAKILAAPQTGTTAPLVASITAAGIADIVNAEAEITDEATNSYIIMSKARYAYYKGLQMAANYGVDPFDGMTVLFNDTLGTTVIVGDLKAVQANFVNGNDIGFKYDDLSLAEQDLVKIVGRLPIAIEVIASRRLAKVVVG